MNTFQLMDMSLKGVPTPTTPTLAKNAKKLVIESQIWHLSQNSNLQAYETPNHDISTYPRYLTWGQATHKVSSSFNTILTQNQVSDTLT